MKRWSAVALSLLLAGFAFVLPADDASAQSQTRGRQSQSDRGWVTLFDGRSLDGWNAIGDANWKIADGAMVADAGNGFLVSRNSYKDFEIRAEFWVDDPANSGIFIRCSDPTKITAENAY